MSRDLDARTSPRIDFSVELVERRKRAKLSQQALAGQLGYGQSLISHIERGERVPQREFAEALDRALGCADEEVFVGLYNRIIHDRRSPRWSMRWAEEVEPQATVLRSWSPLLVPGLLQTEAYAREVLSASPLVPSDQVEEEVAVRMRRRKILEGDNPPQVWDLVDESVLHRPIGGPGAHTAQLHHILAAMEEHDNVTVQLVPLTTGCTLGLMGAFALAQIPGHVDTVLLESSGGGRVSTDPKLVSQHQKRYDTIRANARPYRESLRLIKEEIDKWTNRGPE